MTKIARIDTTPMVLPLQRPYNWQAGNQRGANLVLFTVETEDGVVGYGESICEEPAAVEAYARLIAPQIMGRALCDADGIFSSLWSSGRWRLTPRFSLLVLAGLENACWDAYGKTLDVPASDFFGERVQDRIDFFAFPQGRLPEELATQAAAMVAKGHRVVYIKVGVPGQEDEPKVAAVRSAIGKEPLLRVDANEGWDVETAIKTIRTLEPYGLDWVEQPVSSDDIAGLAQVRKSVAPRIAADQAVHTRAELERVLEAKAADVIVLGSGETGGLWKMRQMAEIAGQYGVEINRHGWLESSLSTFAALQVMSCIPNLTLGNQLMHHLLAEDPVKTELPVVNGEVAVPTGAGFCCELDDDVVEGARARYERDGAYPAVEEPVDTNLRGGRAE